MAGTAFTPGDLAQFGLSPVTTGTLPPAMAAPVPPSDPIAAAGLLPADSPAAQRLLQPPTQSVKSAPANWLPQDPISRFARGVADEATFGLSDWGIAAVHNAPAAISSWFGGAPETGLSLADRMGINRDEARSDVAQFARDNPTAAGIAKGVGVLGQLGAGGAVDALAGAALRTGGVAAEGARAAPSIGNIAARGAISGGVQGAAAGAGNVPPGSSASDAGLAMATGAGVGTLSGGVLGPIAQGTVDVARDITGMGQTLRSGADRLSTGIAGANPPVASVADVGDQISASLAAKADAAKTAADQAYGDAAALGTNLHPAVVAAYPALVRQSAAATGQLAFDPLTGLLEPAGSFPKANAALAAISRMGGPASSALKPLPLDAPKGAVSVAATRRLINSPTMAADATNSGDKSALSIIRHHFNDVFASTAKAPGALVDAAGNPAPADAVAKTLEGNAAWSRYKALTAPKSGDVGATRIAHWIDTNAKGGEVAADLYGLSTNPKTVAAAVKTVAAVKNQFGAGSPEFNAIQQGLFLNAAGKNAAGEALTPKQVKQNLLTLTGGAGKPLAESVFTPNQVIAIKRFANSIPDSGTGRLGDLTLKSVHLAGAAAGAALGLHFIGDAVPLTFAMLAGGGGGSLLSGAVGKAVSTLPALARSAQNPLLYRPLFAQRAARVGGEVAGANLGGAVAGSLPPQQTP